MGSTGAAGGVEPRRTRRSRRVVYGASALALAAVVVVAAAAIWASLGNERATPSGCRVTTGPSPYSIDLAQAANATTIAVVGTATRAGMNGASSGASSARSSA